VARVVVVHGVGQQFLGRGVLHNVLASAVLDGMANAGVSVTGLERSDIEVAFYGEVFRASGAEGDRRSPDGRRGRGRLRGRIVARVVGRRRT
jgi:hypothetical protein